MIEPTVQIEQYADVEQQVAALAMRIIKHEEETREIAKEVYKLYEEYTSVLEAGREGFYSIMERHGIARSTAHRYVRIGRALKDGVDPTLTLGELVSAGDALLNGATRSDVKEAIEKERVKELAEEVRNGGIHKIAIPSFALELVKLLREIARELDPEVPNEIDATGYGLSFAAFALDYVASEDPELYTRLVDDFKKSM